METIKIIDILVNIANDGIVPKKIEVYHDIFEYDSFNKSYWNSNNNNLLGIYNGNILKYEAKIIIDKTLEDILTPDELKCFEDVKELVARLSDEDVNILVKLLFGDKYDEIVDKIKGEE